MYILLGVLILYVLVTYALLPTIGPTAFILYVIVPITAGYLTGMRGGLLFGLLGIPINSLLLLIGQASWEPVGFTIGHGACVVVGGMIGVIQDLREQVKQELSRSERMMHQILESEERFRSLFELAPDGIAIVDMKGVITSVNTAMVRLSGYSKDEIVGKHFTEAGILQARDIHKYVGMFNSLTTETLPEPIQIEYRRKDGTNGWAEVHASWLEVNDEKVGAQVITRDITLRRQIEERLLETERLAAIGEVAAMVGHDLRNPLQAMVNTLYLARKKIEYMPIADKKIMMEHDLAEDYETMKEQVEYMNKIVYDLQDYATPVTPQPVETSIHQLMKDTFSTMKIPETIKVSVVVEESFPQLMIDPSLMRRVFTNLITNALQAMPEGGQLTIKASKTEEAALISVEDMGVGIPEENLDKLFQPLFTTRPKGTGFGLAVCRRLVEAHGGTITVDSKMGRGSAFTVKIPLGRKEVS